MQNNILRFLFFTTLFLTVSIGVFPKEGKDKNYPR